MIAKEILKENSTDIGLAGAAPPPSFIFVAANLTDMKVQSNVDHTTKGKPITGYEHLEEEYAIQLRKTAKPAPLPPSILKKTWKILTCSRSVEWENPVMAPAHRGRAGRSVHSGYRE